MIEKNKIITDYLAKLENEMVNAIYHNRSDKNMTFEECIKKWNETFWHEIIMKEMEKLKK